MDCPFCKAPAKEGDKFCRKCGAAMAAGDLGRVAPASVSAPEDTQEFVERPKRAPARMPAWAGAIIVIVVLFVLAVVAMYAYSTFKIANAFKDMPDNPPSAPSSGSQQSGGQSTVLTGDSLRRYQVGDSWSYNVTATLTKSDGTTVSGSGTIDESIASGAYNGTPAFDDETACAVTFPDGTSVQDNRTVFFIQDSQGDYQEFGEADQGGAGKFVNYQPQTIYPGDWENGQSTSTPLNFNDGTSKQLSVSIQSDSSLQSSSDGQSARCWPVQITETESNSQPTQISGMFCPGLGNMLSYTETTPEADGSLTLNATLKSSSLQGN